MDFGGGSGEGGTVDLTSYLKKTVAEETYAKKTDIDASLGDIESLLGGI